MERLLRSSSCDRASDATHLSLVGGKFKIDKVDLFLRMYSKNYKTLGAHLVEKVSYPSKWYIDLDHQPPGFEEKLINTLVEKTHENCIVCVPWFERDAAHIIFHDIVVNSPEEAIEKTSKLFNDDFDKSVYRTGLRMIGSKKKANVGREYYPYAYIRNGHVVLNPEPQLTYDDLLLATIHTTNLKSTTKTTKALVAVPRSVNTTGQGQTETDFGFIHPNYKNVSVSQLKAGKGYMTLLVKSRFCMNVDREHTSNHVYFKIRITPPMTVQVKCFNECGCKGYESESYRMPVILFYNIKNKLN